MTGALQTAKAVSAEVGAAFARRIAFYLMIGMLALVACGFGVAAGWLALADRYDGIAASLIIAGALMIMAIVCLAADGVIRKRRRRLKMRQAAAAQPSLAPLVAQIFVAAFHTGRSLGAAGRAPGRG